MADKYTCKKCGKRDTGDSGIRDYGICYRCQHNSPRCTRCGTTGLYNDREKKSLLCDQCFKRYGKA